MPHTRALNMTFINVLMFYVIVPIVSLLDFLVLSWLSLWHCLRLLYRTSFQFSDWPTVIISPNIVVLVSMALLN